MPIMPNKPSMPKFKLHGFLTSSNIAHSMPKFPKSFGPFREKLAIRRNFRELMRQIMLNNFKIMLFPKERWFSPGTLSNFRGLVSKNPGPQKGQKPKPH